MKRQIEFNKVPQIQSLQDLVLNSARTYGHKHALEDLKKTPIPRLTYAELLSQVLRFGAALRDLGLPEGSHIAIISENRVQ